MKETKSSAQRIGARSKRHALLLLSLTLWTWLGGLGLFTPDLLLAETLAKTNTASITINDLTSATPYPSTISVSGLTQLVSQVTVTLRGLFHTSCSDISILVVGPQGPGVVLMSGAGGTNPGDGSAGTVSVSRLTFDDAASTALWTIGGTPWTITNGSYLPTDAMTSNYFLPNAPSEPFSRTLRGLKGIVPNGTWSLYVQDEAAGDTGIITNGWSLNIVTAPFYDGVDLTDPIDLQADFDGDGITNLIEYAVGTDPQNPGDGNAGLIPQLLPVSGSRYIALQYKQRVDAAALGLQYLPEVSADRTNWFSDGAHVVGVSVTSFDSEFNWVTVRDVTPVTAAGPRFIRLRVVSTASQSTSPFWVGSDTTIQGNGGSGFPQLTFFSQRMVRPVAYAGTITSLQDLTLTDTNAVWTNGQFGTNGTRAYVEFDNGFMADIATSISSTQSLILADSLSGIASVGDAYRILPHFTIASLFGTNNETGLTPGPNAAVADKILLFNPDTQSLVTIFYFSNSAVPGFKGWVNASGFTVASNQVIYPEQGVMVQRIVSGNADLFLSGPVKTGVTSVPVQPGYNLLGTLKSSKSVALKHLNLYTGNTSTGVVGGANPSVSDNLLVVKPDGSLATYFYFFNPPNAFQGWVNAAGFTDASNVLIPAGSAFFLRRQAGGAFFWIIPAE